LPGLTSRCTMPLAWAACSASAVCARMASVAATGSGPAAIRWYSDSPSTNAITRYIASPLGVLVSPKSYTSTTLGWRSAARMRASARNRAAKPGSDSDARISTFTATTRPSTVSVARQTLPIPPDATNSSRQYRPSRSTPGLSTQNVVPSWRATYAHSLKPAAGQLSC
jgi:hypothetical protein